MAKAIIDVRDLSEEDVAKVEQFVASLREQSRVEKKEGASTSDAAVQNDNVKES